MNVRWFVRLGVCGLILSSSAVAFSALSVSNEVKSDGTDGRRFLASKASAPAVCTAP